MKSFAAIDFETANQHRSSVCSVGVVVVRNGKVTDKLYRLIKPTPNFYTYWCTEVHGMTNADTDAAMDFPEAWAEIAPHIQGLPLVAHNSPFDESCLKAAFEAYGRSILDICSTAHVVLQENCWGTNFPIINFKLLPHIVDTTSPNITMQWQMRKLALPLQLN